MMGCGRDEGDGFDAGGGLARDADASQLTEWLQSEYALPSANASGLARLYLNLSDLSAAATSSGVSAAYMAGEWAETDQSMWCGPRRAAHQHASARRSLSAAYLYRFGRGVGGAKLVHHSDDIPFWFDARDALRDAGALPADFELARRMSSHLAAFVVAGDPGAEPCTGCGMQAHAWPAYTLEAPAALQLNTTSRVLLGEHAAQCAFWDAHPYYGQESLSFR